jgi:hypothetical protein
MASVKRSPKSDGELGLGRRPLARRHDPLLFGAVPDQEKELGGGFVTAEMASSSDRPQEFIQSLDVPVFPTTAPS